MFTNILNQTSSSLSIINGLYCFITSLILGGVIATAYIYSGKNSKSLSISLVLLPVLVQIVIMMVNGNLGTGVAVMGAFSLIRFRSVPGNSSDICFIFFAMVIGLAAGTGYLTFAFIATIIISAVVVVLFKSSFGENTMNQKQLKITIPENLDYTEVFEDTFIKYTKKLRLERVKTTNLGSMYELTYDITLKDRKEEKEFIDELRCRNGNLTIVCGKQSSIKDEL